MENATHILPNGMELEVEVMPHRTHGILDGNILIPGFLCEAILADEWNEELVKMVLENKEEDHTVDKLKFFQTNIDEVRAAMLTFCDLTFVYDVCQFEVLEEKSGEELYAENKVLDYVQQGDWLFKPEEMKEVEVHPETKLRLVSHVYYKLLKGTLYDQEIRALEMGNASWHQKTGRRHIEFVRNDAHSIMDAIEQRNGVRALPFQLS
jgi:hypothetical protein